MKAFILRATGREHRSPPQKTANFPESTPVAPTAEAIDAYIDFGEVPARLRDPITLEPLRQPIRVSRAPTALSRRAFEAWFASSFDIFDPASQLLIGPAHLARDEEASTDLARLRRAAERALRARGDLGGAYALRWLRLWLARSEARPLPDLRALLHLDALPQGSQVPFAEMVDKNLGRWAAFCERTRQRCRRQEADIARYDRYLGWLARASLILTGTAIGAAGIGRFSRGPLAALAAEVGVLLLAPIALSLNLTVHDRGRPMAVGVTTLVCLLASVATARLASRSMDGPGRARAEWLASTLYAGGLCGFLLSMAIAPKARTLRRLSDQASEASGVGDMWATGEDILGLARLFDVRTKNVARARRLLLSCGRTEPKGRFPPERAA